MKISVYTTTDCQFSAQEKAYLASQNLPYEEKNLDLNRGFLTEMLAAGNNFAGTPVTKIEKDDGTTDILKGFTKEEFDRALSLQSANQQTDVPASPIPPPIPTPEPPAPLEPTPPTPMPPEPVIPTVPEPTPTPQPAPTPAEPEIPPVPVVELPKPNAPVVEPTNDALNSLLANLQKKAGPAQSESAVPTAVTSQPAPILPTIPDFP